MSGNGEVRDEVLEAIRAGKLPNSSPSVISSGPGRGASCVICGEPLKPDEVEFELEYAPRADGELPEKYHAHLTCFSPWDSERKRVALLEGGR
jgi:hypothetical protein